MSSPHRLGFATITLLTLLVATEAPLAAAAGLWTPAGPEGGGPQVIAAAPGSAARLYAAFPWGQYQGLETLVMRSSDGGATWQESNGGLEGERITALAVDPLGSGRVFAVAAVAGCSSDDPGGVYRTEDAGAHWQLAATSEALGLACASGLLALPDAVLVGTRTGVARSTDGGATWQAIPLAIAPDGVHTLLRDPFDARVLYAAGARARFKSMDGGLSWTALDDPASRAVTRVQALAISRSDPGTLYEYGLPSSLSRSRDGGATWGEAMAAPETNSIYTVPLLVDPQNPETVYVGAPTGLWVSRDGGTTFQLLRQSLPEMNPTRTRYSGVNDLELDAGQKILLAAPKGLWSSLDAGFHWTAAALHGVHANEIRFLRFDPFNPRHFLFTSFDSLYESRDGGTAFAPLAAPQPGILQTIQFDPFHRERLVALVAQDDGQHPATTRIFTSADGGHSWVASSLAPAGASDLTVATPDALVAIVGGKIFLRQGNGVWRRRIEVGPADGRGFFSFKTILADPYREGALFALGFDSALHGSTVPVFYRSLDAGLHWALWHEDSTVLAFDPLQTGFAYTGESGKFFRVRISNGGDQQIGRLTTLDTVTALLIDRSDPQTFYAGTGNSGVLVSHDRARHWSLPAPGLPLAGKAPVTALEQDRANPLRLYATPVTGGLWRLDL